jgi:hypothetical protein
VSSGCSYWMIIHNTAYLKAKGIRAVIYDSIIYNDTDVENFLFSFYIRSCNIFSLKKLSVIAAN